MLKTVLIASVEAHSGKSMISVGLMSSLLDKKQKVAYFKPVINGGPQQKEEAHIAAISSYFNLPLKNEEMYACSSETAFRHLATDSQGELLNTIIARYKHLADKFDFTVVEGTDFEGEETVFEFELNVQIAKNLGAPIILVGSGEQRSITQISEGILTAVHSFEARHLKIIGIIINKVRAEYIRELKEKLKKELTTAPLLGVVPLVSNLQKPSVLEINNQLQGQILCGRQRLSNKPDKYITGVMAVNDFMDQLQKNTLVIMPGDREDIFNAMIADGSLMNSKIAALILTEGYTPAKNLLAYLQALQDVAPVITTRGNTIDTFNQVDALCSKFISGGDARMRSMIKTFNKYVDVATLNQYIAKFQLYELTPHMFQYKLIELAKAAKKRIVLPEGNDERILKAVARLIEQGIVDVILFGKKNTIAIVIKESNIHLDLDKVKIIDPADDIRFNDYADTLYQLRKAKGLTLKEAQELMKDESYFATMMVYKGDADGMVSGAVYTTRQTIRPALQFIKGKPGRPLISSVFLMCLEDRVVVFGDCSVNPNPTAEDLAEIALSSAETGRRFGIEPLVAMLSYSSGQSGEGKDVDMVRRAVAIVKTRQPDLKIDGPMQYDAAVDPVVGHNKMPDSEVAGKASVFVFPDLDSGNNIYKAVQREAGAVAIGPILQGLNKPVNDLSRGSTVDDIFNTVLVTAIQCEQ